MAALKHIHKLARLTHTPSVHRRTSSQMLGCSGNAWPIALFKIFPRIYWFFFLWVWMNCLSTKKNLTVKYVWQNSLLIISHTILYTEHTYIASRTSFEYNMRILAVITVPVFKVQWKFSSLMYMYSFFVVENYKLVAALRLKDMGSF